MSHLHLAQETLSMIVNWFIDWCLMPTLAVFQLYHGANDNKRVRIQMFWYPIVPLIVKNVKVNCYSDLSSFCRKN
jgi:hypothetical protein